MLSVRASAVVVSLALIMVAAPVRAQAPVVLRDYEQYLAEEVAAKESNPILDWYLIGLAAGLVSTFNYYQGIEKVAVYCPPSSFGLSAGEAKRIIAGELATRGDFWRKTPNVRIETIVVESLARRFPCR